jgi:hypothetical protein
MLFTSFVLKYQILNTAVKKLQLQKIGLAERRSVN